MDIISFYPTFRDESIDKDARIAEFRAWLEQHGEYGRLFMWDIGRIGPQDPNSYIRGVKIFEGEIATLFKLMFEI